MLRCKSNELTAGWGLVNGPFGKARMLITEKKNITAQKPYQMFFSPVLSSLKSKSVLI